MRNATHNRISHLLPLVTLAGLVLTASAASAGVNVWTTNGPEKGDTRALAFNPATLNTGLTNHSVNALAIDPSTSARSDCGARQPEILSQDASAHKQSMRTIADEMAEVLRA
jgi:hypothetical protein